MAWTDDYCWWSKTRVGIATAFTWAPTDGKPENLVDESMTVRLGDNSSYFILCKQCDISRVTNHPASLVLLSSQSIGLFCFSCAIQKVLSVCCPPSARMQRQWKRGLVKLLWKLDTNCCNTAYVGVYSIFIHPFTVYNFCVYIYCIYA